RTRRPPGLRIASESQVSSVSNSIASWISAATSGPHSRASLVLTRPGSGFLPKIPSTQSSGNVQAISSPPGRATTRVRGVATLRHQQSIQERGIDDSPEPHLAVDRHDRYFGVILPGQVGFTVDVDFLDGEPKPRLVVLEQIERL